MASINNPVDIKALLDAQTNDIKAKVVNTAAETKEHVSSKATETKRHITTRSTDTKKALIADNDVTQDKVDNLTTVNSHIDSNVQAINTNTNEKLASQTSELKTVIGESRTKFSFFEKEYPVGNLVLRNGSTTYTTNNSTFKAMMGSDNREFGATFQIPLINQWATIANVVNKKGVFLGAILPYAARGSVVEVRVTLDNKVIYQKQFTMTKNANFAYLGNVNRAMQQQYYVDVISPSHYMYQEGVGEPFSQSLKVEMKTNYLNPATSNRFGNAFYWAEEL